MAGPLVGIDLGTTGSLVALVRDGAPEVLPNTLGERITPSAVTVYDAGAVLVGAAARARASTHPDATAVQFKRDMGTEASYTLAGRGFDPITLSALVLSDLRASAEAALGVPVRDAVITVPAYFGEAQRQATRQAGEVAGLRVHRIVNEPTAAALAYGLADLDREVRAVVLDLGGGTFDVTVLEVIAGVVEVQATAGDARLGGEDFSDALADLVAGDHPLTPAARTRLREACDRAKRRLSDRAQVEVALDGLATTDGGAVDLRRVLSRPEAEQAWLPLLARMRDPIQRALRDARWQLGDIDEILLVGGATRMPAVRRLAERLFGRAPRTDLQPDETVALGAAVQAALLAEDAAVEDLVATDVAPFTLGTEVMTVVDGVEVGDRFCPMIERGTTIPVSRFGPFVTSRPGQDTLRINIYQGEHPVASRNTHLGVLEVDGLEAGPDTQAAVEIRFTYDLNGLLEVECTPVGGEPRRILIDGTPGKLSPEELEAAREAMARLKVYPRELLPNATALARAEALYTLLLGGERQRLADALSAFEVALATQDEDRIAAARRRLLATVEALEGPGA